MFSKTQASNAATAPPQASHEAVTKEVSILCMIAGYRQYDAPHMYDIGESDPRHGGSLLLGVRGLSALHIDFASSNQPFSWGAYRGISQAMKLISLVVRDPCFGYS